MIDIGVNFTNSRFDDDRERVLARAADAGVTGMLLTGTCETESAKALSLARQYSGLWSTAGVHPHDAAQVSDDFISVLENLAAESQVKAIGECGLDFNRNFSPPEKQLEVFELQVQLAQKLDMPLFLHERDAFEQQLSVLYSVTGLKGVAHCFTGTQEQMLAYLDLGLYIGVTGWLCDPKRGKDLREAVTALPLSRLLLETDAPFLTPKTLPGKVRRNEPCYLPHIAEAVADIKQVAVSEVINASTENAKRLFDLPN